MELNSYDSNFFWFIERCRCMHAKSLQSCLTLCDHMDCIALQAPLSMGFSRWEYWNEWPCPSAGDLPDPGIKPASPAALALQADSLPLSHWGKRSLLVQLCHSPVTPRTVAYYAALSMRFPRQDYWLDCHCPSPGDLPDPVVEPRSPALQADSLLIEQH